MRATIRRAHPAQRAGARNLVRYPELRRHVPESELLLPALTRRDFQDPVFASVHAYVVELSFVNRARDVRALRRRPGGGKTAPPAVTLKIETRRGFSRLPQILLAALRLAVCGVVIARGDSAVECGDERPADGQEENLRLCETAHVTAVRATQAPETSVKRGIPARAEITYAAMGERPGRIMLAKGSHSVEAVQASDRILRRMEPRPYKKRAALRRLAVAGDLATRRSSLRDATAISL